MKTNETGRSMVEMLGVLAIIGVLSVAGIAGYSMAMKKIKVNDILSAASQCAILARTYQGGTTASDSYTSCGTLGLSSDDIPTGVTMRGRWPNASSDTVNVKVTLTTEDQDLINQLAQMAGHSSIPDSATEATLNFEMN